MSAISKKSQPLSIAVLTVSDTRQLEQDTSGALLIERLTSAGHTLADRQLIPDDLYRIRAVVSGWIADPAVQTILITGGTGMAVRDVTPEAIKPLLDKTIDGFGELFRSISYQQIGVSTLQSRCLAGFANRTLIFCLPGSTGACKTAWDDILQSQLDVNHRPCNFVAHLTPGSGAHA